MYCFVDDTGRHDQLQCVHHKESIEHGVDPRYPKRDFVRLTGIRMDHTEYGKDGEIEGGSQGVHYLGIVALVEQFYCIAQ